MHPHVHRSRQRSVQRSQATESDAPDPGEGEPARRVRSTIRQFVARLRVEFAPEIARDPRGFKRGVVHLLKVELPPYSGRPSHENVTRADEMRKAGKGWKEIYVVCLPQRANPVLCQRDQYLLRGAVRARRRRRMRTKSPIGSSGRDKDMFQQVILVGRLGK